MLNRNISHNQFLIFSLFSLFIALVLAFLAINEIKTPDYTEENYFVYKHTKETSILVFGDMMLDRHVKEKISENGPLYPFELIKDIIPNNDIVIANAEGPFTFFDSKTLGIKNGPLEFTFDPSLLITLKKVGFTLLGQANNHTLNFGTKGFAQSTTSITIAGLDYFGDPSNDEIAPYIKEINGERIGFIAYNEFSYKGKDKIISTISEIKKQVSYLIVYSHWGVEYNSSFTKSQQKIAYEFIDAGADAVIGMHPHVIEPIEIYNGKLIFYSLGNFIFDQAQTGPMTEGLALKILINKKYVDYEICPIFIKNVQASIMDDENKKGILDTLATSSAVSDELKESITNGEIRILR